jgi:NAD(P)-dependent dehydrogenase (short-subunit alcohol dehydrogenase family)
MRLENKVAVVTGATSGFGLAISDLFAAEAAALVMNSRTKETGERLVERLRDAGTAAQFVAGDVGVDGTAEDIARCAQETFGRIDVLVLNAGIDPPSAPFWEVPRDDFDLAFRTNVRGAWLCAQATVPLMNRGSSIVMMASMASTVGFPGEAVYCATKGAVLLLVRTMALELAERGIRVNALCPGICDTPMTRWFIDHAEDPASTEQEYTDASPLRRMGTANEIARAALFLASDDSSYCTGSSLVADGGYTAR